MTDQLSEELYFFWVFFLSCLLCYDCTVSSTIYEWNSKDSLHGCKWH